MSNIKLTKINFGIAKNIYLNKGLHKQFKSKTIQKGNFKLKESIGANSVFKFAKMTRTKLMQTRNAYQSKEKDEIDAQLSSNLNRSSNNRTLEATKQINLLNKTNTIFPNNSTHNALGNYIKNNTISESILIPQKQSKLVEIKQIQFKQRPDTFQMNEKLNDYLKKDSDQKATSLFSFPEIKDHKPNSQIPYEYLNDFLDTFCNEEQCFQFKIIPNFIDKQQEVNNRMRAIVVNWLIEVHHRFKLLPNTLYLSVLLFDRYMSLINSIEKKKLQLIGVTSLLLACKYEEIFSPEIRDFVCILDQTYDKEDLMKQENDIMKKLKFEVAFPSSLKYYDILCIELNIKESLYDYGSYLLELTLLDSRFSKHSQAVIASTVCFMVLKFQGEIPNEFFERIQIPFEKIKCCLADICFLIDNIDGSIFQAVVKKYKHIPYSIKNKCTKGNNGT